MAGQTLAQLVRGKFPGVYDDMDDAQLEAAIDAKYPGTYDDVPRTQQSFVRRMLNRIGEGEMNQAESLRQMPDVAAPVAVGGAKGVANTLIGAGEMADAMVPGLNATAGTYDTARRQFATPNGPYEQIGFGAEQVAEFVALPTAKGGLVKRVATEGLQSGALAAAQGADARTVGLSALPGAAVPLASHAASGMRAASGALRESAERNVSQALNPTTLRNKRKAEQLAPGMLDRGTFALTKQGLKDKATQELDTLGGKFDEANAALPSGDRMPVEPIRDAIQSEMLALLKKGSAGKSVPINPEKYRALEELDNTLGDLGDKVSRETLQAFKEEWMDAVAAGGGYAERTGDSLTRAQLSAKRHGADAIRRELAKDSPDIDALNAEWSFWSKLEDVTDATIAREKPQKGAMRRMAGIFGGLAGGAQGGVQGAAIGAGVGSQLMRAFDSPGWKLASAHAKNKLAEALVSGNPERVSTALGRVIASMPTQFRTLQPVASH